MLQNVFISCFSFFILRQGIFLPPFSLVFFMLLSYCSLYVCSSSYSIIKITCTLHDFCSCLCQHPRYKIDVALRGTLHQHMSKVNFAIVIKKPLLALFLKLEMCYIAVYINFHPRSELHCFFFFYSVYWKWIPLAQLYLWMVFWMHFRLLWLFNVTVCFR